MFNEHLQRVKDGVADTYNLSNLSTWISKNTRLEGRPFSYKDREYQVDVIDDPAKTVLVNKIAQSGLSEIFARWAMAAVVTQPNFTLMWTFPSSTDAENFTKQRLDPLIAGSKAISSAISKHVNSVSLKQFNDNSFAYVRGTISETGALSVPADLLIHDELDRSDMDNIAAYVSRLQAKATKMRRLFSTPTVKKYGIDLECETARRKRQVWKCSHCNHTWLPSYDEDIHIPGWTKTKKEITKATIKDVRWKEAVMLCPSCLKVPDSDIKYRSWVVENHQDNYDKIAYYISPFCAPSFMTPSYLVNVSTSFGKWSEFQNQALGLPDEDAEESLTENDIRKTGVEAELVDSSTHYLGADMGLLCHVTIVRVSATGELLVVHREKVSYAVFETRRLALIREYRITTSVHDMFPYTDIVRRITDFDPNAFGAIYVNKISTETHYVKEQEEEAEEGKLNIKSVMINREVAFDHLMAEIKGGRVIVKKDDTFEEWVNHLRDMKRVRVLDKHGGFVYKWKKTQGVDHWHHSLLYAQIAAKLRGMVQGGSANTRPTLVSSFVVKSKNVSYSQYLQNYS